MLLAVIIVYMHLEHNMGIVISNLSKTWHWHLFVKFYEQLWVFFLWTYMYHICVYYGSLFCHL